VSAWDLVLTDAFVVDGSGKPGTASDVGVRDGRIDHVGPAGSLARDAAHERVDVAGRCLAPGFIDSHTHSDVALLGDPDAGPKVSQGVTTEVIGNCGWSTFPGGHAHADTFRRQGLPIFGHADVPWTWSDMEGYADALARRGTAVNVVALVGHGALRANVMGFDDREADPTDLEAMSATLDAAMRHGAAGLSTGLAYAPGCYASTEEIAALAAVVARHQGLYATHLRDQCDGLVASVEEALSIGEQAGLPVLISHHKAVGPRNVGLVRTTLARLDERHLEGPPTYSDVYPYLAGSSTMLPLLPPWVLSESSTPLSERLNDSEIRRRIRRDLRDGLPGWENRAATVGWEQIRVARVGSERNAGLVGRTLADIATERGVDGADALLDLLADEDGEVSSLITNSAESDLLDVLRHDRTMIGSDGLDVGERPHPRLYGTFPRILGRYVRDQGALTLEQAVHKMTGLTAGVFRLTDRGLIRRGFVADMVLFEPDTVQDLADYEHPRRPSAGIHDVWVAGRRVLREGRPTGERPGSLLRHRSHPQEAIPCP